MNYIVVSAAAIAIAMGVLFTSQSAFAGSCVTKTGYYVPYNCSEVGRTATGKIIMICC